MKNQDLIDLIEHGLRGCKSSHDDQMDKIADWIKVFDGEPYGNEEEGRSKMVWKMAKKHGESLISNIAKQFLGNHQIVDLTPLTAKDTLKAPIYADIVNHFWSKEFNANKLIKSLTRVAVKEGTAFIRVGWEKDIDEKSEIVTGMPKEVLDKFAAKGAIITPMEDGSVKLTNRTVRKNRPTAKLVRNEDVYFDVTADTFEECKFLIYEYTTTMSDLRKQPDLYAEADVDKLERILDSNDDHQNGYIENSHEYNDTAFEFSDKSRRKVRLYEYWGEYDLNNTGRAIPIVAVMARYGDEKVLLRMQENPFPFKEMPFICVPLIEKEFAIWGQALADMIEDEQKFSTSIVRGIIDNMAASNSGTKFVRKNSIDAVNYDRLVRGDKVVEVNTNENINTAVMDGNFNQLPQSVFNMLGIIDQQADSLTGISKMMQGIPGSEMKAASSNFSAIMSQSQIRLLDMTTSVTTGLRKMFFMWTAMAVEYLDDQEIQKITGVYLPELKAKETQKLVKEFQIEELPQETQEKAMMIIMQDIEDQFNMQDLRYDVDMKVGTDGLKDIKINQINMLMQQAAGLIQNQVVPPKVLGMLFADMSNAMDRPDIAKIVEEYEPQPDPMAQEMQAAQVEGQKASNAKDAALAKNADARSQNLEVKTAKEVQSAPHEQAGKQIDNMAKASAIQNEKIKTGADAINKMEKPPKPGANSAGRPTATGAKATR